MFYVVHEFSFLLLFYLRIPQLPPMYHTLFSSFFFFLTLINYRPTDVTERQIIVVYKRQRRYCGTVTKECGKKKKNKEKDDTKQKINILYLFCIIATLYTEIITKRNLIVLSCNY